MGFFIAAMLLMLAYFSYYIEKRVYNPATILLSVWGILLALYELKLYGMNDTTSDAYTAICLGLLGFFVGYIICVSQRKTVQFTIGGHYTFCGSQKIRYGVVRIVAIIVALFLLAEAIESFVLMRAGFSLFEIRSSLQGYADYEFSESLYGLRSTIGILYPWFITPSYNAILILACIDFFYGKKDKLLIGLALICMLLKGLKEGSRLSILYFIIYLVFSMLILGKRFQIPRRIRKWIKRGALLLGVVVVAISLVRVSEGQKGIFEEIYFNFTCCFPLLGIWIDNVSSYTNGAMSLYGIIQPIVLVMNVFSGHSQPWYLAAEKAIVETETFYRVRSMSYSANANAYTSMFYYFFKDGGFIGVVIGGFLFGLIATTVYKKVVMNLNNNTLQIRNLFWYLLILQALIFSFVRIYSAVASYSMTIFYAFLYISASKDCGVSETDE